MAQSKRHGDPFHQAIKGLKRSYVDVLTMYSYLPEARREVEMRVKIRVFKLIECVVHTRKWVGILTRNFVKSTVVKAHALMRSTPLALRTKELASRIHCSLFESSHLPSRL
jgi:uncharacterized membrane protein